MIHTEDPFYSDPKWKALRHSILLRDKYMCTQCKRNGLMNQAEHVHHIFPREQYTQYEYECWNLTSLCFKCHNKMHNRFNGHLSKLGRILMQQTALEQGIRINMKQTILVIGIRGTGKSTYVRDHLDDDSMAYDMDAIASAFRLRMPHDEYHKPSRRMANDFLTGFLAKAHEYVSTIYVIRTAPTIKELQMIDPDSVVICTQVRTYREMDDRQGAFHRIEEIKRFCAVRGLETLEI